ncbi:MAG TPA: L-serine ammonia-lyase, iron-sulfur-dependent, subunit beta [Clostridiales bacterium]|nr:L-serine ammonia-lyase, iron-sulfur-dependent, subunit beta [Clostridiales bacterium]
MNVFEVMGPVMVGPSSSHTAGAVKIAYIARQLLRDDVARAEIFLHGSFLATGVGHGTDRAIVAGLLSMRPDDERIPDSFSYAKEAGMEYLFDRVELRHAHPNSVLLKLHGKNGNQLELVGSSIGGGAINIDKIDGLDANFDGNYPTLIIHNVDEPGHVADISTFLEKYSVNIATLKLYRDNRGGRAVMVIECDQEIPLELIEKLRQKKGILKVSYLSMDE